MERNVAFLMTVWFTSVLAGSTAMESMSAGLYALLGLGLSQHKCTHNSEIITFSVFIIV